MVIRNQGWGSGMERLLSGSKEGGLDSKCPPDYLTWGDIVQLCSATSHLLLLLNNISRIRKPADTKLVLK
jgi:hypothetical protein